MKRICDQSLVGNLPLIVTHFLNELEKVLGKYDTVWIDPGDKVPNGTRSAAFIRVKLYKDKLSPSVLKAATALFEAAGANVDDFWQDAQVVTVYVTNDVAPARRARSACDTCDCMYPCAEARGGRGSNQQALHDEFN